MGVAYAVASGKGGVGKTSIAVGVAGCLSAMGKTVLLVDADVGFRNIDLLLGMSGESAFDFGDVLRNEVPLKKAISEHPDLPGLFLLNAPGSFRAFPADEFPSLIFEARDMFDYVFVDCPAGIGEMLPLAAACCNRGIVVITLDPTSIRAAERVAAALDSHSLTDIKLVVNRVRVRLVRDGAPNIDDAMDSTGLPLLGVVPEDERVIRSSVRSVPIILEADDGAAESYFNIARRIEGERVPLMKLR